MAHEETPFAVGMRCLGDSTTAATALPALGTSLAQLGIGPVLWSAWLAVPVNGIRLSHHAHAPCFGSLPREPDEACSHFLLNRCILWACSRLFKFVTGKWKEGVTLLPRSAGFAGFFPDNTGSMCCHSQDQVCITLPSHALQRSQLLPSSLQGHTEVSLTFFTPKALQGPPVHVAHNTSLRWRC